MTRLLSTTDRILVEMETILRTVTGTVSPTFRPNPADKVASCSLSEKEARHSAGLMRVNHAGEVCAQALYQGQALMARSRTAKKAMAHAAIEEADHLAWCQSRLNDLNSHASYLSPVWYLGSLGIGVLAGALGDSCSLGFVAETERQVVAHLNTHLATLPRSDTKSRAIVTQMCQDESRHATTAVEKGGIELPRLIKALMRCCARVMTTVAYRV